MEKIQSAIAKARATREGRLAEETGTAPDATTQIAPGGAAAVPGTTTGAQPTLPGAALPDPGPSSDAGLSEMGLSAGARAGSSIDAAWKALPLLKTDTGLMRRNRIVAFEGGHEAATFDVMRTRLLQQMRANNWRRVAITSPTMGCGKTTTCLNLAFSLARQSDLRMVLAEVDLRRPALSRILNIKTDQSFARVLDGSGRLADNAMRYGSNLAIASNHAPYRNPAELLHGPTVGPALAALETQYQPTMVLFDMPPLLAGDDVLAFIGYVDCVLLVAAAETSTIEEVDTCERELAAHTNVLGVVLNKCRYPDRRYGYSYA
jgi:Mrp family chromosome partitioning ATPase